MAQQLCLQSCNQGEWAIDFTLGSQPGEGGLYLCLRKERKVASVLMHFLKTSCTVVFCVQGCHYEDLMVRADQQHDAHKQCLLGSI